MLHARPVALRSASFLEHLHSIRARSCKQGNGQGHRRRRNFSCEAEQHSSATLQRGQMDPQAVPEALSQVELLMQQGSRMTSVAQAVWAGFAREGDTVVDATCGNGHDSKWLAQAVGPTGMLYAFDIQEDAIRSTRAVLEDEVDPARLPTLEVVRACHSTLKEQVRGPVRLVCFNLGYLPGGDREVISRPSTTREAVEAALDLLQPSGLVSVLCYTGHPGGREEYEVVRQLGSQQHPDSFTVFENRILSRPNAPVLLLFWKRPAQ
ncbi:g5062 [Coccomyxa viridis]|uniref:G5062 protein n=1 Tax=Coccomyxa viridis TaxID=1274662 RepID=A0ABP1FRV3_9CHLO